MHDTREGDGCHGKPQDGWDQSVQGVVSCRSSEALSDRWRLTKTRLIGPGGRILPLSSIQTVRPILGAVQVITRSGDKHLIKYLADPDAVADRIARARS